MRWVAIGLSIARISPRVLKQRPSGRSASLTRGWTKALALFHEASRWRPRQHERVSRGGEFLALPGQKIRFVCLGLEE
jgi:hypothetical protein